MKTEQTNIRLDADLVAALERVARAEGIDRPAAIKRLLELSLREWEITHALDRYRGGEISLGRASEESGLSEWEVLDEIKNRGIAYPLTTDEVHERLGSTLGKAEQSLPDIPPNRGGVLLVGINPAPDSVAAGHYYQGRVGHRLWRRLERVGLLRDAVAGSEDEAFARAGHGLTDLVKRPTRTPKELRSEELEVGVDRLRGRVREWKPRLVLFAFKEAAVRCLGRDIVPGRGPEFEGVPTFLLTGPYAPSADAAQVDDELRELLGIGHASHAFAQPVTANDVASGQLRIPTNAKKLFPPERGEVDVLIGDKRVKAQWDPRVGPDRERSGVLRIGRKHAKELPVGARLQLRAGRRGTIYVG